jgi:argininosuccinate synthase
MKVGVLWSGGLDSTFCIWEYLTDHKEDSIVACYVEVTNNADKTKMAMF